MLRKLGTRPAGHRADRAGRQLRHRRLLARRRRLLGRGRRDRATRCEEITIAGNLRDMFARHRRPSAPTSYVRGQQARSARCWSSGMTVGRRLTAAARRPRSSTPRRAALESAPIASAPGAEHRRSASPHHARRGDIAWNVVPSFAGAGLAGVAGRRRRAGRRPRAGQRSAGA
ncbi:MAG: hypothetical protein MZV65_44435 [Chromatiales bacterium]|nr:hypothetical protein [Chromatiales bacterium]